MKQTLKIFVDESAQPTYAFVSSKNWKVADSYMSFESKIYKILDDATDWIASCSFSSTSDVGIASFGLLIETCVRYGLPMPTIYVHSFGHSGEFEAEMNRYNLLTDNEYSINTRRLISKWNT